MEEDKLNIVLKQQAGIIGEVGIIREAYPGYEPLTTYLDIIEHRADITREILDEVIRMNPLAIFKAMQIIQEVFKHLPEDTKKAIDAEIDKLEDKYKQGSIKDLMMEQAMKVVRLQISVPDYPDVIDEPPLTE